MAKRNSIMRSLGQFFGHIAHSAKRDVEAEKEKRVLRQDAEEADVDAPEEMGGGKMKLRRTTIEEVEFDRRGNGGAD